MCKQNTYVQRKYVVYFYEFSIEVMCYSYSKKTYFKD